MHNAHAPQAPWSAPPVAAGGDTDPPAAECTSIDALPRNSLESTTYKGGGRGKGRDALSVHLESQAPTGQRGSQVLYASIFSQRPNEHTKGALHSANADGDASMHHLRKIGASSLYYSHCPPKHANLEESFLTDDKHNRQRQDFSRTDCKEASTLSSFTTNLDLIAKNNGKTTTNRTKYPLPSAIKSRFVVKEEKSGPSGKNVVISHTSLVGSVYILIALALASTGGRMMIFADAAFAPSSRAELQGDGVSTLGVFGCVGSCALITFKGYTYCDSRSGAWASGTGDPCNNADTGVPNGQGTGTYGTMGSWDVSKVDNMAFSKCSLLDLIIASPDYCNIPSSRLCLSSACDVIY